MPDAARRRARASRLAFVLVNRMSVPSISSDDVAADAYNYAIRASNTQADFAYKVSRATWSELPGREEPARYPKRV